MNSCWWAAPGTRGWTIGSSWLKCECGQVTIHPGDAAAGEGIDRDVSGPAIPAEVVRLAEDSNAYQPLGPNEERIVTARYVLYLGSIPHPAANAAQRLRLDPANIAPTVEEVRSLVRGHGLDAFTWEVST